MFGLYQVSNKTFNRYLHGVNFSFEPTDGVMFLGQVGWTPEFFRRPFKRVETEREENEELSEAEENTHGLPGHYWFGAYYSTWEYAQFGSTQSAANAYGFYWHADQKVYQEAPGSDQGLTLWTAFVLSPQENIAKIPFQWNCGVAYQGVVPQRDQDIAMFGLAYGSFSDDYGNAGNAYNGEPVSYEMALEWGYRIQFNRFLYAQPNIQYIVQPGGTGSIPDAFVLGMQIGVTF
jgi:porin